jgi:hypothetical protein
MDIICSQYGWTVAQIFEHTRDQIEELVDEIGKRKNEEIKFQATIHGAKLKDSGQGDKALDLENDIDKLGSIGINVVKG